MYMCLWGGETSEEFTLLCLMRLSAYALMGWKDVTKTETQQTATWRTSDGIRMRII